MDKRTITSVLNTLFSTTVIPFNLLLITFNELKSTNRVIYNCAKKKAKQEFD